MEVWRHSQDVIHQFKQASNAVLFAAGSCWEGVDFPGDMVSSLIIVRLPFPVPDPLSEAEREQYPTLAGLHPGGGDPGYAGKAAAGIRAGHPHRNRHLRCQHFGLPGSSRSNGITRLCWKPCRPIRITRKIEDVEDFIRAKKSPDYFLS